MDILQKGEDEKMKKIYIKYCIKYCIKCYKQRKFKKP